MEQLELFEETGLQPIKRWLYVWTDAEREKKAPGGLAPGESLPEQAGRNCEEVMRLSSRADTPSQHLAVGLRK